MRSLVLLGVLLGASMGLVSADTTSSVCDFSMDNMYVPDANQTAFPVGFLPCRDVKNATIPRCQDCDCRQLQSVQNGGNILSWGVCVEGKNETNCEIPASVPARTLCNVYVLVSDQPTATPPGSSASSGFSHPDAETTLVPEAATSSKKTTSTLVTVILCSIGVVIVVAVLALCCTSPTKTPPQQRTAPTAQDGYKAGQGRLTIAIPRYPTPTRSHSRRSSEYIPPTPSQFAPCPQTGDRASHFSAMDSRRIGDFIVDSHRSADTSVYDDFMANSRRSFAPNEDEMDSSRSMTVDVAGAAYTQDEWDVSNRSQFTVAEEEYADGTHDPHTMTSAFKGQYWRESDESAAVLQTNRSSMSYMDDVTPHSPVKVTRPA